MAEIEFSVPLALEYSAAFTWAVSGTIVGMRKGYDMVGVFVVAVLSSFGGGLLRDGIFLHRTPVVLTNTVYLPLVLVATISVAAIWRLRIRNLIPSQIADRASMVVDIVDAIGTPAFVVVGIQLSLAAGIPIPGVLLVGFINGVGGGLLRDVIVDDEPAVLKPGIYAASLVVAVSVVYVLAVLKLGIGVNYAAWVTVVLYFVLRMLVLIKGWRTRPVLPKL